MTACPYGIRQFNWQSSDDSFKEGFKNAGFEGNWFKDKEYRYGYPLDHRTKDSRLVFTLKRPKGVVEKCTFCVQYVDQGLLPACVRGCPGNARIFGDLNDPNSDISKIIRGVMCLNCFRTWVQSQRSFIFPRPGKKAKEA